MMSISPRNARGSTAPELPAGDWVQAPIASLNALRGRPVILYFWRYTSLPSLTLISWLRGLEQRYSEHRLAVVGIHMPLLSFEREREQVILAAQQHRINHPTLLDNDYQAARDFQIPTLPYIMLVDPDGLIRHRALAVNSSFERALQLVLREIDPAVSLTNVPQVSHEPSLTELIAGVQRGSLGNPEGYAIHAPILYRLPQHRHQGSYYVEGAWRADAEHLEFAGSTEGLVRIPYEALEVYAVVSSHHALIERMLKSTPTTIEVWQDDLPLSDEVRGDDVTADGRVIIERPGLAHLVRNTRTGSHELSLRVRTQGFSMYAFYLWGGSHKEVS